MDHAELRRKGKQDHESKLRHHMGDGGGLTKVKSLIKEAVDEHDDQLHGGKKTRLKLKRGGHVEGEEKRHRLDRAAGGRTKSKGGHKTIVNVVMPQGGHDAAPGGPGGPGAPSPMMPPHPPMAPPPGAGGPPPGMAGAGGPPPGMPPRPPMGPPVGAGVPMPHKKGGRVKKAFGGPMDGPLSGGPVGTGQQQPMQPPSPQATPPQMPPQMARPPMQGAPVGAKRGGRIEGEAGAGSGLGRLEKIKDYGTKAVGVKENESFAQDDENKKMRRGGRACD